MSDLAKKYEDLKEEIQNKLAFGISKILRSIDSKEKRFEGLKNMNPTPSIDSLKRVYKIAIDEEDYETCGAIKDFFEFKGLDIDEE